MGMYLGGRFMESGVYRFRKSMKCDVSHGGVFNFWLYRKINVLNRGL